MFPVPHPNMNQILPPSKNLQEGFRNQFLYVHTYKRVGLVWMSTSKVHTRLPGALLSAYLACTLLAHFASQALCQFCHFCLSQVHKQGAKINICALLAHFLFCVRIILIFAVELFITCYCWPQTPNLCFAMITVLLPPAFCCCCHHHHHCCHHSCQPPPTTNHHPLPCLPPPSWHGSGNIKRRCAKWLDNNDI